MIQEQFFDGDCINAYEFFGAHLQQGRQKGCWFRAYAPKAQKVSLICSDLNWEPLPMIPDANGVYCVYAPDVRPGCLYKYRIAQKGGRVVDKSDPFGFQMELRPNTASIVTDLRAYQFDDQDWMAKRDINYDRPMNIYELHCGSWRQKPHAPDSEEDFGWLSYAELAKELIPYLLENHYTHVELMPISEHPFDGSWGYQSSGFYAATSRYGTPDLLQAFVDECHRFGIGVIFDFIPVHFVTDDFSLQNFDGTHLYEYDNDSAAYSVWGSMNFDYFKRTVCSFLMSAAAFWLDCYHADGLRMDAVSNVLYWQGDATRGVNIGGIQFLKTMNYELKQRFPTAMLIAEDSTSFLKVTAPVLYDGLGFDYKWNLGWMNDTLAFFKRPPIERASSYHQLSFSMLYFYNDLFLLPFSHDEVVHGKATIIQKMWGDYDKKFPQARTLYTYMFTHPGKKLNFMGNEIGHFREWDEKRELDWDLLTYPLHDGFYHFIRRLQELYTTLAPLYDGEYNPERFRWLEIDAPSECVYVYRRGTADDYVVIALNLSDRAYTPFYVGVDEPMQMREVLNSDRIEYGGSGRINGSGLLKTEQRAHKGHSYRLPIALAPFGSCILQSEKA